MEQLAISWIALPLLTSPFGSVITTYERALSKPRPKIGTVAGFSFAMSFLGMNEQLGELA